MAFTSVNRLYFSSIQKSLDEDFSSLDKSFHAGVIVLRTHSHLAGIKYHICANQKTITHCHPEKLNSYVAKTLMRKLRKPRVPAPILRCLAGWSNFKRNLDKISWIFFWEPSKEVERWFQLNLWSRKCFSRKCRKRWDSAIPLKANFPSSLKRNSFRWEDSSVAWRKTKPQRYARCSESWDS